MRRRSQRRRGVSKNEAPRRDEETNLDESLEARKRRAMHLSVRAGNRYDPTQRREKRKKKEWTSLDRLLDRPQRQSLTSRRSCENGIVGLKRSRERTEPKEDLNQRRDDRREQGGQNETHHIHRLHTLLDAQHRNRSHSLDVVVGEIEGVGFDDAAD